MHKTILRLALLGTVAAAPAAWAQTSPATPDRDRPAAATEGSTRPGMAAPAPNAASGANMPAAPRADSVRPASPDQGVAAGQGVGAGTGTAAAITAPRTDAAGATTPNRGTESGNNAVAIDAGTRMGPLEPGANSFTEGQARGRMEAAGFTNIEGLQKDDSGIWRGRGMRSGQQVEVGLDYRGNVNTVTR